MLLQLMCRKRCSGSLQRHQGIPGPILALWKLICTFHIPSNYNGGVADPNAQNQVHAWLAETWLSQKLNFPVSRQRVKLTSGGGYSFPAVSEDEATVAIFNTSLGSGKNAASKLNKVRSDFYFLLLANASRRVAVFTDRAMFGLVQKEQREGRVPDEIELMLVGQLPAEIDAVLKASQQGGGQEPLEALSR